MPLKKFVTTTIALGMLSVTALQTIAASADSVDDTQKAIASNQSETDQLLKEIATANADNIKLAQQITTNSNKIDQTKSAITQATQKISQLDTQIKTAKVEVTKRTATLKTQLVALQKQTGDTVSGNVYLDFVLNSKDFSDLISRTFTVNKLNQASKAALDDVKTAKTTYTDLMAQQQATKTQLQADQASLETQQNELKELKIKSDQQQAALTKKINDNRATLVALQTKYDQAASALKAAKTTSLSTKNDQKASTATNKLDTNTGQTNAQQGDTISQGDGAAHGNVAGNSYAWGQCTWYVKQVAPWAGNNWGNGGQWGASAAAAGFKVDHTPAAGAIIVFLPGQSVGGQWTADGAYGHVGYVQSVNGSQVTITQGGMGFSNPAGPNNQTISNAGSYLYIHR